MTAVPLSVPPESMRPDRSEVMTPEGSGRILELGAGVKLECLVGRHNGARGLTTGVASCDPVAAQDDHTHPFTESITVLRGRAVAVVEGREYEMGPLDNLVVPPGLAHRVQNRSATEPALFHIAFPSESYKSSGLHDFAARQAINSSETGERFNRFETALRFEAGPNTSFIDFFNETLMPGIEMSGGYGLFAPSGRLPAHVHDFDESICIIHGEATCIVEGSTYRLDHNATAMVPGGGVHYFINASDAAMAMLWVYAGPAPIRIVVDERCATKAGAPWGANRP